MNSSIRRYSIVAGLAFGHLAAMAHIASAAQVSPTPAADVAHNGTATGSAVTVLADGTSVAGYRTDCHLQNNGTHVMYYQFGTPGVVVPATTSSLQLQPGFDMYCNNGVTISSTSLSVLGTSGDTYALNEQFVRGQ